MKSVKVSASREYDVVIGEGLLSEVGERIATACGGTAAMLVCDDNVERLYADEAERSLQAAGYAVTRFVFPNGESSKTMETLYALLCALAEARISRSDVIVALGGGVTGDLAGYAASVYLRGVTFAQVPTTLLAMVDSSVGGKTAIDLPQGKNMAGAFHQPGIVICDINTLKTLPTEIFQDGCAEMIKHGAIRSAELFALLKEPLDGRMEDIIARNVSIKRDVVALDEFDTGIRAILNFGHTVAHGIEKYSEFNISHGKAVAAGMAIVSKAAYKAGLCAKECYSEIADAIMRFSLPIKTDITPDKLVDAIAFDKKRSGENVTLIVPQRIGECVPRTFTLPEAADFLSLGMRA